MEMLERWTEQFGEASSQAVARSELPGHTDINQLVFEITAMLVRANFSWVITGDTRVLDRAREGIRHVLGGVARQTGPEGRSSRKRVTRGRSRFGT
jgi:hypothetical protein